MILPMRAVGCIRSIHASKVLGTSLLLPLLPPLMSLVLPLLLPVISVVMLWVSVSSTDGDSDDDDGCVCGVGGSGGRGWAKGSL